MRSTGELIVTAAARVFEEELRSSLRAKLLAQAQAEIEHTIDEVVRALNTHVTCMENVEYFRHDVHFFHRSVK